MSSNLISIIQRHKDRESKQLTMLYCMLNIDRAKIKDCGVKIKDTRSVCNSALYGTQEERASIIRLNLLNEEREALEDDECERLDLIKHQQARIDLLNRILLESHETPV